MVAPKSPSSFMRSTRGCGYSSACSYVLATGITSRSTKRRTVSSTCARSSWRSSTRGSIEVANFTMFEYAGQMRPGVLAIALVIAAAPLGARERVTAHPPDETEVFTGGEEVAPGEVPRRPALAYWEVRATPHGPADEQPLRVGL